MQLMDKYRKLKNFRAIPATEISFFILYSCEWRLVSYCALYNYIWVIILLAEQFPCATSHSKEVCDSDLAKVLMRPFQELRHLIFPLWYIYDCSLYKYISVMAMQKYTNSS